MRDSSTIRNLILPVIITITLSLFTIFVLVYASIKAHNGYKPKQIKEKYEVTFSKNGKDIGVVLYLVGTPGKSEWVVERQDFAKNDTTEMVIFKKIKKRNVK